MKIVSIKFFMSKSKSKYWDNYYGSLEKSDKKNIPPSQFAAFCSLELIHSDINQIIEIAAGEGRDSIFFVEQGFNTIALDKSTNALNLLKMKESLVKTLKTVKIDAVNEGLPLPDFPKKLCAYYARFFIHTLEENDLKIFFKNLSCSMKSKDLFLLSIETIVTRHLIKPRLTILENFMKLILSGSLQKKMD